MEFIFWISLILVIYTYVGYPLFLSVIVRFYRKVVIKADIFPVVSLIVAAYNEEKVIEKKIKNSLFLDYPNDKIEIIIASDCSTDKTNEIVEKYKTNGVNLIKLEQRKGKTAVQNKAVSYAKGEILIFSDATTIFSKDAVKKIVRNFNDKSIGCVGGQIIFKKICDYVFSGEKNASEKYDEFVRTKEGEIKTTFGLTGCLYAVRRRLYTPLADDQTSDLVLPLIIVRKGYRVICDAEAIAYEELSPNAVSEFRRRVRTTRAGIKGVTSMLDLLKPSHGFFVPFGLVSHKILRWASPYFMICIFAANIAILHDNFFYRVIFGGQGLFYAMVAMGYVFEKIRYKPKIFTFPFNFVLINIAAILGFIEFLKGHNEEIWQTERG